MNNLGKHALRLAEAYHTFDGAHNYSHFLEVHEHMKTLNRLGNYGLSPTLMVAAAAYHDLGLASGNRELHHLISGKMVREDNEIEISPLMREYLAQAVEDHRASVDQLPRSDLGRVLADADRMCGSQIESMLLRARAYDPSRDFDGVYAHLSEKYGDGGYAKYITPEAQKLMKPIRARVARVLGDKKKCRQMYIKLIKEER